MSAVMELDESKFVKPTPSQRRWLRRGLDQAGGKLPLFDEYGRQVSERTVKSCIDQGWAERFDMSHEAGGFGDTPEQVAAFRTGRDLLFGYAQAAQNATLECLERLTSQDMEREYDFYGNSSLGSRLLTMMVIDVMEHTGQIAYLRGMITGHGWHPY